MSSVITTETFLAMKHPSCETRWFSANTKHNIPGKDFMLQNFRPGRQTPPRRCRLVRLHDRCPSEREFAKKATWITMCGVIYWHTMPTGRLHLSTRPQAFGKSRVFSRVLASGRPHGRVP